MNNAFQIGVFLLLAVLTCIACSLFPNASTDPETGLIMWLPNETQDYVGENVSVSPQEAATLPKDTRYLKMSYRNRFSIEVQRPFWDGLAVTLILAGTDRRSLHEPEICLGAQGWEIEKSVPSSFVTSGGELEVMDLFLGRWLIQDGEYAKDINGDKIRLHAHYVYWWVSKEGSTAFTDKRIMQTVLDNFLRNKNSRWGYPSVFAYVDPNYTVEEGRDLARAKIFTFLRDVAPKFQKSLGAKIGGEVFEKGAVAPLSKK